MFKHKTQLHSFDLTLVFVLAKNNRQAEALCGIALLRCGNIKFCVYLLECFIKMVHKTV